MGGVWETPLDGVTAKKKKIQLRSTVEALCQKKDIDKKVDRGIAVERTPMNY